jgi:WD40 repeat protein
MSDLIERAGVAGPTDPAGQLERLWRQGEPPDVDAFLAHVGPLPPAELARVLCVDQRQRWQEGQRVPAEDYLKRHPALNADPEAVLALIFHEFLLRERAGEKPSAEEYMGRFPQCSSMLSEQIELHRAVAAADAVTMLVANEAGPGTADAKVLPALPGYELLEELGRGGMGVVYKARHVALDRLVALKMVLSGEFTGEQERARFRSESLAVARLSHTNVVQIFEVGEHDGRPFFVMEFCGGGSLADCLEGTPWPALRAAELVATLARAVHAAHQAGVIHRDLKPANVLMSYRPDAKRCADAVTLRSEDSASRLNEVVPKIGDFGLAKRLDVASQTQSGAVMGTPSYMAPEQAVAHKEVGPAADVYALGAILYELLTGWPPFRGATPLDTVLQVLSEEPVPPRRLQPGIPRDLETICLKCLLKLPSQRYGSALDLAEDLLRFRAGQAIRARPVAWPERLWRACRRNPVVAGLTAALALFLVAAAVVGTVAAFHFASLAEQARRSQTAAENNADESRRRLVQQYIAAGERLAEEGDFCSALAWLAEALDLDRGGAERERHHRIALQSLLRQGPRLLDVWFLPELANPGRAASPDGQRLLAVDSSGGARVWDADTHGHVSPPLTQAGEVRFAAFSPDGGLVLTVNTGHAAQVWEAATGRAVTPVLAVDRPIKDAVLTNDGRRVLTLTKGGEARLWDGGTGKALPGPDAHLGSVQHIAMSPNGTLVVTVGDDRKARLWKSATGEPATRPLDHPYKVWHASFSPDGKILATAAHAWREGGRVSVWSTETGEPLGKDPSQFSYSSQYSYRVLFSPDGKRGITVSGNDVLLGLGDGSRTPAVLRHKSLVHLASFSADGSLVLTTTQDMTGRLWDAATGEPRTPSMGPGALIWHTSVSRDGRRWHLATQDGLVRTWATARSRPARTMRQDSVMRLALSPDGRRLATADRDGLALLWDLDGGGQPARMKHRGTVPHVAFSRDGALLVTCGHTFARVWDGRTGQPVTGELRTGYALGSSPLTGGAAAFSPDAKYLVTAGQTRDRQRRGTARIWEARTGRLVKSLPHTGQVYTVEFSPDGRHVLTCSDGGSFVWDVEKGAMLLELARQHSGGYYAAYSPDGSRFVTANWDRTIRVWEAETGRPVSPPMGHATVWCLAFSPNGGYVLTGGEDQTARVWDAQTGQPRTPPLRHLSRVADASFSADGRFVVTSSQEGDRVWDAATGRLLTVPYLPAHGGGWGRAALTPDNRRLVSADHDDFVRVWEDVLSPGDEPVEDLLVRARLTAGHRAGPGGSLVPLTPAELQEGWEKIQHGRKGNAQD